MVSKEEMIMSNKWVMSWREVVVICFKTVSWNSPEKPEDNHEKP
jgi:hypothetical protein